MINPLLTFHRFKSEKKNNFNVKFYQNFALFIDKISYVMFL